MNKIALVFLLVLTTNFTVSHAICHDKNDVRNEWIINLNTDDLSSKRDVMDAFIALNSAVGFSFTPSNMPNQISQMLYVKFNPKAYSEGRRYANSEKRRVLKALSELSGIEIFCVKKAELHDDSTTELLDIN